MRAVIAFVIALSTPVYADEPDPSALDDDFGPQAAKPPADDVDNTLEEKRSYGLDDDDRDHWQLEISGGYSIGREQLDGTTATRRVGTTRAAIMFFLGPTVVAGAELAIDVDTETIATALFLAPNFRHRHRVAFRPSFGFGPEFGDPTALRVRVDARLVLRAGRLSFHVTPELAGRVGYADGMAGRVSYVQFSAAMLAGVGWAL